MPLSTIAKLEHLKSDSLYTMVIICKDFRAIRIMFDASGTFTSTFLDVLSSHAFPGTVQQTFAFFNKTNIPNTPSLTGGLSGGGNRSSVSDNWWNLYSPLEEFTRQGVLPFDNWYLYSDNYRTVDTYPKDFIMPSQFSMSDVGEVGSVHITHDLKEELTSLTRVLSRFSYYFL